MTLDELIWALKARWRIVAITFSVVLGVTMLISLLMPKTYTAQTTVVADLKSANPISQTTLPVEMSSSYLGTQVEIINSDRVAQRVVELLKLEHDPKAQRQWHEDVGGRGSFSAWAGQLLDKKLDVEPGRNSNVITISFPSRSPQFAADVANAFAQAYLETSLDLNVEPAKRYAQWFEDQTNSSRMALELAQKKLSEFQQQHGIVATDDRLDVENARLAELSTAIATAQAQWAVSSSRGARGGADPDSQPEVLADPLIASLRSDIARQQAQLDQMSHRLGKSHPEYVSMAESLASLKAREAAEVKRVETSLTAAGSADSETVTNLQHAFGEQKRRVLELKAERDQAAVLQRDVDSAQRAYDLVSQRLVQSNLESQLQQTNVGILNKAQAPVWPSSPRIAVNLAVGVLLGGVMGIALALFREARDQRLRSAEQLGQSTSVPVLGVISRSLVISRAANDDRAGATGRWRAMTARMRDGRNRALVERH